ncbi:hypothetical protein OUZ56_021321 [Daphnia magna]|uniref:Uncharacterized protein n=1 Tax=Daphnia magna TaxID=35525 RepID=A0ABQ9ZIG9_9CRUS|nr:hypothetical protein OUZ56_021321 [Daphnia magna]
MQRVSELRMRRWGRHEAAASSSISASELELSLRSASLNTSFSTTETICETATTTSSPSTRERRSGGSFNVTSRTASTASSDSPVNFEFCRASSSTGQSNYHGGGGGSRAASPLLNGSSPCPSPTPRSPRSPMTPRSSRSPCRSPSSQQPSPGHQTPTSASPHPYSSRRRSGVATGNLARLASRRSSRDSEVGEPSPLQCVRNHQRRTSNFLEIPVAGQSWDATRLTRLLDASIIDAYICSTRRRGSPSFCWQCKCFGDARRCCHEGVNHR